MGRRADHDRKELLELATAAARETLHEKGAAQLSVRGVMQRIGYSPGTFYNLFANFDALALQLAGETLQQLLDGSRAISKTGDPIVDLKKMAHYYLRFTRDNAHAWQHVLEHRLPKGEMHPKWYRLLVREVFREVESATRPLYSENQAARLKSSAITLWASVQGICIITRPGSLTATSDARAERMCDELVDLFVAGLRAQH